MDRLNNITFPLDFKWGHATAAPFIESDFNHQWLQSRHNPHFDTVGHEQHLVDDLHWLTQFGKVYRCSLNWSTLQHEPFAPFDEDKVEEYLAIFKGLRKEGIEIMLTLYHFAFPKWMEEKGGWLEEDNIAFYVDFARQCILHFGAYVQYWVPVNEPVVYTLNAYWLRSFPPFKKGNIKVGRVIKHLSIGHKIAYALIKQAYPDSQVASTFNPAYFQAQKFLGILPAHYRNWRLWNKATKPLEPFDFIGIVSYTNGLDLRSSSELGPKSQRINAGSKSPTQLIKMCKQLYKRSKKPIWFCGNTLLASSDTERIELMMHCFKMIKSLLKEEVPVKGYLHWSTFDSWDWQSDKIIENGLVRINWETKERHATALGSYYTDWIQTVV